MNRGDLSNIIRRAGLLHLTDFIRFHILRLKNRSRNRAFRKDHPRLMIPPDYLLYESFAINYSAYFNGGRETANDLYEAISRYKSDPEMNVLDWGCGPGRIIRHMPDYFGKGCKYFGTDYNDKSIKWCSDNISDVSFSRNNLSPPLPFTDRQFDVIYGISIFTHLSEIMHHAWIKELYRVLNKDGVMLLTTAGKAFIPKLTKKEKIRFEEDGLIIRSRVKEGHRTFTAIHPAGFIQNLFSEFTILEHIERKPDNKYIPQDIWIIKKTG